MRKHSDCSGFSLIELVVVLAVLAIIAMIALPSYQTAVRKARRAEGKAFLHMLMMSEERHHAGFNRYTADVGTNGLALPTMSQPGGYYALSRVDLGANAQTVRIVVSPQHAQAADSCGDLILDSTGLASASGGPAEECG
ncbi:MAG: type IV pilin protein [Proteobacteria bacterium]|uniref:type IV pilin protein n=1 Tax=Rudaea sp. TaxID=2136325 RepID=UPI001DBF2B60|nr:type IV pilin protein [Pseudomonadota bacterium]MBS0567870.1 type IV pilin protein [Pseudomonadota bacterium]